MSPPLHPAALALVGPSPFLSVAVINVSSLAYLQFICHMLPVIFLNHKSDKSLSAEDTPLFFLDLVIKS